MALRNERIKLGESRLPATLLAVPSALEAMKTCFENVGIRAKAIDEFRLAVAEGLNNAVKHGCHDLGEGEVQFRWGWCRGEGLWVEITDPGHFEPSEHEAELPADLLSESGRGGFLMASLADRVEHRAVEQGHMLILEKCVDSESTG